MPEPFFGEPRKKDHSPTEVVPTPYEFFDTPQSREEVFTIGKNLAKYVREGEIDNVVFMDRAARPAYIALRDYWRAAFPKEPTPHIYFVNPRGFKSLEDLLVQGITGAPKIMEEWGRDEVRGDVSESPNVIPETIEDVQSNFERTYRQLVASKDKPTLIFDTCIHEGETYEPVNRAFMDSGFTNLHFGVMSNARNSSGVKPELITLPQEAEFKCYPFDTDSMIKKTFSKSSSLLVDNEKDIVRGLRLRDELKRIMREKIAEHHVTPSLPIVEAEFNDPS